MSSLSIEVQDLSKAFKLFRRQSDKLLELTSFGLAKRHEKFQALKNVSFKVSRGESYAILGHNGAGKSTLLKILSGVMNQSSGTYKVDGRIAALLELGAGFDLKQSGYENIFFH